MKTSKGGISVLTLTAFATSAMLLPAQSFARESQATIESRIVNQVQTQAPAYTMPNAYTSGSGGSAASSGSSAGAGQLLSAGVNAGAAYMYYGICSGLQVWACAMAGMSAISAVQLLAGSSKSKSAGASMSGYDPSLYQFPSVGGADSGTGTPGGYGGGYPPGSYGADGTGGNGLPGGTSGTGTPGVAGTGPGGGTGGLPPGAGFPTTPAAIAGGVNAVLDGLKNAGVTISADGSKMTTKDGRTFDMSKGGDGSAQGLMAMGMSASEAEKALAMGKSYGAQMAAKIAKMGLDGGSGGGGGGGPARGVASEDGGGGSDPFAAFRMAQANKRVKPKVSGLTKKLGDDTIGVSGDDIFEMVTRRYKARDQDNQFLKD